MYRHTTPTPLDVILENCPDRYSDVPLADYELEVETEWGDYQGLREGAGWYCDLSHEEVPVGRLWTDGNAVGLLHVPVTGYMNKFESEIQYWNASAELRKSYHDGVPASEAFGALLEKFDHSPVEITAELSKINYPEIDAIFYQGRYDPEDGEIWCKEMQ